MATSETLPAVSGAPRPQQQQQQPPQRQRLRPRLGGRFLGRSLSLTVADAAGQWKEAFGMFDQDLDGVISAEELARETRRLGVEASGEEIQSLLSRWDRDRKGSLSLLEFTSLMNSSRIAGSHHQAPQLRQHRRGLPTSTDGALYTEQLLELKAAFDVFDRDGDGALSQAEVRAALELLGEEASDEDVAMVMLEADANGNGSLSFKEFCDVLEGGGGRAGNGGLVSFPGKSTHCRPCSIAGGGRFG